jgi:hypothetical protein
MALDAGLGDEEFEAGGAVRNGDVELAVYTPAPSASAHIVLGAVWYPASAGGGWTERTSRASGG